MGPESSSLPFGAIQSVDQLTGTGAGAGSSTLPGSGGGDLFKSLGVPQISNEEVMKAITPVQQRGPMQMPSAFTTPHSQILPPAQMDNREVVGAGNARAQGIGNSVSAVVRTLSNFKAKRDLVKQEADATRVQRLLEAQAAMDQAQTILKQDPNNAEAKQSLEHNKNIVTGMFQDPKFVKTVEKGFQISLTDPSANKTPDHNVVQRGIDLFKKKTQQPFTPEQAQAMGQKFAAQAPTQMAPNQLAQQQLQMKMQQQQMASTILKAYMPMMTQQLKFDQAKAIQHAREIFQSQMALANATKQFAIERFRAGQRADLETSRFQHALALEALRQVHRVDLLNKAVAAKSDSPLAIQRLIDDETKTYNEEKSKRESQIQQYEKQLTDVITSTGRTPDQGRIQELRRTIDSLKAGFQTIDTQHAKAIASIQSLIPKDTGGANAGSGSLSGGATAGGQDVNAAIDSTFQRIQSEAESTGEDYDPTSTDPSEYELPQ